MSGSSERTISSACSRLFAREAALKIANEGVRLVAGGSEDSRVVSGLGDALRIPEIYNVQSGLLADMNFIADALYDRS